MAKYYNHSNKYLWNKGLKKIFHWFIIGFVVYLVFLILNKKITGNHNDYITIIWFLFSLYLLLAWQKHIYKIDNENRTWIDGLIGELLVGRELKKLSNDFYVIASFKLFDDWNIDYVVVCSHGVYSIEVKSFFNKYYRSKNSSNWGQV